MQPATESLAAIVSSNGRKDAATRPVPFPSEGSEFKTIKLLGMSLGKWPCIELHGRFSPYPKLKITSSEGLDAQIL